MAVRGFVKSLVLRSVEPTVRSWVESVRQDNAEAIASLRTEMAEKTPAPTGDLASLQEEVAQLKKKLSMAMGAMQAASAQIVQLRQDVEAAQNLAKQAMQKATTAQSTAEAATDGIASLEDAEEGEEEAAPIVPPSPITQATLAQPTPAPASAPVKPPRRRDRSKKA
jgi:chromosome segregation ATPase